MWLGACLCSYDWCRRLSWPHNSPVTVEPQWSHTAWGWSACLYLATDINKAAVQSSGRLDSPNSLPWRRVINCPDVVCGLPAQHAFLLNILNSRHVSQNAISPPPLDQATCLLASRLVWNYGEGREKRKKLVWKLAVLKAFGVKGGPRCYRKVAGPFADIWLREHAGIWEDWFSWETHIPPCNVGLRK